MGVLALGLAWVLHRAQRGGLPGARRLPRALLVVVVALAAGEPRARDPDPPRTRVFVVDRSRSFAPARAAVQAALDAGARDLDPRRDRVAAIAFGASPVLAQDLIPAGRIAELAPAAFSASVDPLGSDLGAALLLAREKARQAGGACEVVLLSDGADTGGQAREAAALLAASSVVLHVVAPAAPAPPDARLSRLATPSHAAPGEVVLVEVEVETTLAAAVRVTLTAEGAGARVEGASGGGTSESGGASASGGTSASGGAMALVHAEPGAPARLAFRVRAGAEGVVRLRARADLVGAEDALPEDDVLEGAFVVGDRSRATLCARAGDEPWRGLLEEARFDVSVVGPERLERAVQDDPRGPPDLIVLDEVRADELSGAAVATLRAHVEAGGGLVVAGDTRAFGPGGYPGSSLDALLPVRSGPPDEQGKPLALELVLDSSASMAQEVSPRRSRFLASVDAAVPRGRELRRSDLLGVVLFSETPHVERPLSTVADEGRLLVELKGTRPDGGTAVVPGLLLGLDELSRAGGRRLLVLVTDAEDPRVGGQAAAVRAAALAAARGGELEVALVLVGEEAALPTLEGLARAIDPTGKHAHAYAREAGPELGRLIRGELIPASRGERRQGSFALSAKGGFAPGALPAVTSYAPVRPRELARTLLRAQDPEREGPAAIAVQGAGPGGAVVALATSLAGGGAALAREPAGRAALLALLRGSARARAGDLELTAERTRSGARLVATSTRGDVLRGDLEAVLGDVGGVSGPLRARLVPVAPGRLEARISPAPREAGTVRVESRAGGGPLAVAALAPAASLELAAPVRDVALLAELAALTGDERGVSPTVGAYAPPALAGRATFELAPWLALVALGLVVLEGAVVVVLERLAASRAARRAFEAP